MMATRNPIRGCLLKSREGQGQESIPKTTKVEGPHVERIGTELIGKRLGFVRESG